MFGWIANLTSRHPRAILVATLVFVVASAVIGGRAPNKLTATGYEPERNAESVRTASKLRNSLDYQADPGVLVLVGANRPVASSQTSLKLRRLSKLIMKDRLVGAVEGSEGTLIRLPDGHVVAQTASPRPQPGFVSHDGLSTYLAIHFRQHGVESSLSEQSREIDRLDAQLRGTGLQLSLGGSVPTFKAFTETARDDLIRAEALTLPLLFLLLVLAFRGLAAALIPLSIGVVSVSGTFLALTVLNELTPVSIFALNVTTALGLGLAIDYGLLLVSRYREEIDATGVGLDALRRTLETAGRTVVFSGLTVTAAMLSLLAFPQRLLHSMAWGGAFVALLAVLSAIAVVPAFLIVSGKRIEARSPARSGGARSRWYGLASFVLRHPAPVAIMSAGILLVATVPFVNAHFTHPEARVLPSSSEAHQVDRSLRTQFPPGRHSAINVVVPPTASPSATTELVKRLERLPATAAVSELRPLGRREFYFQVISRHPPFAKQSIDLVNRIRSNEAGAGVSVGGSTAEFVDFKASVRHRLLFVIIAISVTTLALLFVMTRSFVLPFLALAMNALTLGAAFGTMTFVFGDGRLEGLFDYTSQDGIDTGTSVLMFVVVMALSTDYGVFLFARIREEVSAGASTNEAIAVGVGKTGAVISTAALLFCVAIGGLLLSKIVFLKEVGFAIVLAVAIDATIVRALLVPAVMRLLGPWSWWRPGASTSP